MNVFPITPLLGEIGASLAVTPRLVLEAPPGAGKTTQVPLALLSAPWLVGGRIIVLEPRRIAARAAARFMAQQLGEAVGQTVGYRIRFESAVSAQTRIEVVTEGILTRQLQADPELPGVGAIVLDEFHERHLASDLGAVLALDVQATLRPDLRLLVMSATLDGERVAHWLQAPRLTSPGRSFPVRVVWPPARAQERLEQHVARVVRQALAENPGDVLVFLPGRREIAQVQRVLAAGLDADHVDILPLHGDLPLAAQQLALTAGDAHGDRRRVVLATNVAESSVTLPGVCAVVDSGLAREPRFDPNSGFTRLQTVNISQASAEQRAGRAGRVAPGTAYRLWPESRHLEPARTPEMAQVELSALALELAGWGVRAGSDDTLRWLDAPPAGALAQACDVLSALGALDGDGRITATGRRMLALGTHPRLAAAAVHAPALLRPLLADLLALLETRSPLRGSGVFDDDLRARVLALHAMRDRRGRPARDVDAGALAAIERASQGWRRRLRVTTAASGMPDRYALGELLLPAFPDRVARRDEHNGLRYTLANGRGARLHEASALLGEPWLLALELRLEARDSLIVGATPLDPQVLQRDCGARFAKVRTLSWNPQRGAVEAFEEQRFASITLERRSVPVAAADALPALLAAVRGQGLAVLPWTDGARRLRARMLALRAWRGELGLPDVGDAALLASLEDWLAPCLLGRHRLDAVDAGALTQALAARFDHAQRRMLNLQAPEALRVPSGQQHRLDYADADSPVLAVKLQEMFGLADTPRVADGRVAVTLHLLSPAGRPIQVTQDLRGFWERTYPLVRKELKGRYPRHPWPEDPWCATPTHRAKPRPRRA